MELKDSQSALILEADADGEVTVNVASVDINSLPAKICSAIAKKLIQDEKFQAKLMAMLEEGE